MSTTRVPHTSRPHHGRRLHLVDDRPASGTAPRPLGHPQRIAVALVGLTTGFLLGACATALGGGEPGTLATLSMVCLALAVPALIASRRQVRHEMRGHGPAVTSVPVPASFSAPAALRALPELTDITDQPFPRAA